MIPTHPIPMPVQNDDVDLNQLAADWYSTDTVQFLLSQHAKQREVVLFHNDVDKHTRVLRPLFIGLPSFKYWNWFTERFDFKHTALESKIYCSVAHINWDTTGLPPRDLNGLKEYRHHFNTKFAAAITDIDFVMDIDADKKAIEKGTTTREQEFQKTKQWACQLHDTLANMEIPHLVNFSGGMGFNFRTPSTFLPAWTSWHPKAAKLAKYFAAVAGIPYDKESGIDLSVYDTRRVFKLLYSLAGGRVVLPVNTKELWDYQLEDYEAAAVLAKQQTLYNHFTDHQKTEDESKLGPGVVYNYPNSKQNLLEAIKKC